jgi:hypothetical protein
MNKDIAGKITSDVSCFSPVIAATAKELKATRRGMPPHSVWLKDYTIALS